MGCICGIFWCSINIINHLLWDLPSGYST
jgi:hypothetical protein